MSVTSKVKEFAEWLEHGKTIFDLLVALGIGKVSQIVLVKIANIPPVWITPIWLLLSAAVLGILLKVLKRRVASQPTIQSASNILVPAASSFDMTEYFRRAYRSPLQAEVENNIRIAATQNQPDDREGFFVRVIGVGLLAFTYDLVWAYIFRSQLLLLMELNRKVLSLANTKSYYDKAVADNPAAYVNYSFDQWLSFLKTNILVIQQPNNMVGITERGQDFIKYLVHWGRYADDRKF